MGWKFVIMNLPSKFPENSKLVHQCHPNASLHILKMSNDKEREIVGVTIKVMKKGLSMSIFI